MAASQSRRHIEAAAGMDESIVDGERPRQSISATDGLKSTFGECAAESGDVRRGIPPAPPGHHAEQSHRGFVRHSFMQNSPATSPPLELHGAQMLQEIRWWHTHLIGRKWSEVAVTNPWVRRSRLRPLACVGRASERRKVVSFLSLGFLGFSRRLYMGLICFGDWLHLVGREVHVVECSWVRLRSFFGVDRATQGVVVFFGGFSWVSLLAVGVQCGWWRLITFDGKVSLEVVNSIL